MALVGDLATKRSIFGKAKPISMKYAVLLLALMFVGCGSDSSTVTVGYELKDYSVTLQIAKEDLPSEMNFVDAMKACEGLGDGFWERRREWNSCDVKVSDRVFGEVLGRPTARGLQQLGLPVRRPSA